MALFQPIVHFIPYGRVRESRTEWASAVPAEQYYATLLKRKKYHENEITNLGD